MRPFDRWSRVSACIAVAAGVRAESCTIDGAELDLRGVRADPGQRREGVRAPRLGGPDRVVAEPLGLLRELDEVRGGAAPASSQT